MQWRLDNLEIVFKKNKGKKAFVKSDADQQKNEKRKTPNKAKRHSKCKTLFVYSDGKLKKRKTAVDENKSKNGEQS